MLHSLTESIPKSLIIPMERISNFINICFNVFTHCLKSGLKGLLPTCGFMNIPSILSLAVFVVCISPADRSELRSSSSEMYFLSSSVSRTSVSVHTLNFLCTQSVARH